jgi:Predicted solute binding protein
MTEFPDEYGEILRRAMRAEADSVVPSPDGLEIIRNRIAQRRGLRGVFWWRAAASAVGAVLVAASIVMIVPGLREQATPPSQGITEIGAETDAPEGQSTSRPPSGRPPEVSSTGTAVPPPPSRTEPSAIPSATPSGSATPSATPGTATPSKSPTKCPSPGAKHGGTPDRPSSCPGSATRTPTPTPTPTPTETEEPGCGQVECPASDEPPADSPGETADPEPTLSAGNDQEHGPGQE